MGITNLDRLELNGEEVKAPITSTVTKTVGVGGDFENITDAFIWASTMSTQGPGIIVISLKDGTHLLRTDLIRDITITAWISLKSEADNATNCIVTIDPDYTTDVSIPLKFGAPGFLSIRRITFDFEAGGYDSSTNKVYYPLDFQEPTHAFVYECIFKNWAGTSYVFNIKNKADFTSCTFDTISKCMLLQAFTKVLDKTPTNVSVTTKYSIPINEIQYDGRLVTDNVGPVVLKA